MMKFCPSGGLHLALHESEKTEFVHVWETGVEKKGVLWRPYESRAVLLLECALEEFPLHYTLWPCLENYERKRNMILNIAFDTRAFF